MANMPFRYVAFRAYVFIGGFLGIFALGIGILALRQPNWKYYDVDKTLTDSGNGLLPFYDRNRGLFGQCLLSSNSIVTSHKAYKDYVFDSKCILHDFGQKNVTPKNANYNKIINYRRSIVGVFSGAMLFLVVYVIVIGYATCTWFSFGNKIKRLLRARLIAGFLVGISAILLCTGMILFHICMNYETILAVVALPDIYSSWSDAQRQSTAIAYGYCYYVGWGATAAAAVAGFVLVHSALWQPADPPPVDVDADIARFYAGGGGVHNGAYAGAGALGPAPRYPGGGALSDDAGSGATATVTRGGGAVPLMKTGVVAPDHFLPRYPTVYDDVGVVHRAQSVPPPQHKAMKSNSGSSYHDDYRHY